MFHVKVKMCGKFIEKVSFAPSFTLAFCCWHFDGKFFFQLFFFLFLVLGTSFYFVHDLCSSINAIGETMWASFEYWLVYCFVCTLNPKSFTHFKFFNRQSFSLQIRLIFLSILFPFFSSSQGELLSLLIRWEHKEEKVPWIFHLSTCVFIWFFIIIQIVSTSQRISMGSSKKQSMMYLSFSCCFCFYVYVSFSLGFFFVTCIPKSFSYS